MDRNREARRAAAMANGLHRRRHRTTTNHGTLRDSPEEEGQGPVELQEAARFRDRTARKERDRERDRDRVREKDRERLSRSKRRRGDKYLHGSNSVREDGTGGGIEDSSEESVNDDEDDYDDVGPIDYAPPSNLLPVSTLLAASSLTSQRKSYPPPSKVYRVTPTWKAADEMIGVSVPRKARSASTKRAHESWSSGVGSDHINRIESLSAARLATATTTTTTTGVSSPAVIPPPLSPSSSAISMKKKFKPNGAKHRPPKPSVSKSSSSFQDEIEIEVAEVLYGLMRQSQPPGPSSSKQESLLNDSATVNATVTRSSEDLKSGLSSTIPPNQNSRSSAALTVVAPIRKRPRLCPDDNPKAGRSSPVLSKSEMESSLKQEAPSPNTEKNYPSTTENGGPPSTILMMANDILPNKMVEEISVGGRNSVLTSTTKIEEVSSLPKLDSSQIHHRVESSFTSTKPNTTFVEKENRRGDKFEIDLMSPASPEKEEEIGEYGGNGDEKTTETKSKPYEVEDLKSVKDNCRIGSAGGAPLNRVAEAAVSGDESKAADLSSGSQQRKATMSTSLLSLPPQQQHQRVDSNGKERSVLNSDNKLNFQQQKQKQQLPKVFTREDSHSDKPGGQSSSVALPVSVPAGWHGGGLAPMGYVGPLQGVVSMDGTTMASPPIQTPPPDFRFSQQKPKRCATHCYIAGSICLHQRLLKMNTFWPAPANGTAPLFGTKTPSYNLNMVPSADIHSGRGGGVISVSQEGRGQPFTFFPGQPPPASSKDTFSQAPASDPSPNKQFLLQPGLPPPAAGNMMHAPALFFPMGQQQAATSVRPGSGKNTSTASTAASTITFPSSPVAAAVSNASPAGPAMSFSYGNETPFMAILGNGHYPFPIPAHVGAAPPYRGAHPQPMSFFNGSFYSSQMLHPSQLQQSQSGQNHQNANISTATSSSQKQLQHSQQQRPPGISANNVGNPNQNQNSSLQNFQPTKGREMGGEDSPSTADSRNRSNLSIYGQNFVMPFNSPSFALMPSSLGGCVPNGNHGDKKQQQQQQSQQSTFSPAFPMSFPTINGGTAPGLDISSMSHNHAFLQSLPEAAKQSYHMMAAAQAAQLGKTKYRGLEDGKNGAAAATDPSSLDEERRVMAARASASSSGQSIAFSRDLAENSVVESSARSLNLVSGPGSIRPSRSSGPHSVSNSPSSQQQSQMLFPKQQQYTPPAAASARSKTLSTNSGNLYPDHLNSSPIMAAKFPSTLSGFPSLVQASVGPNQSQWKNSVRPNTSQSHTPSPSATTQSNMKTPLQQGRPQQTHTQISFGPTVTNSNLSTASQGQQSLNISQAPSSPMMVGSPSNSSISKSAGGSPRTSASNKSVGQGSTTLSSQQGPAGKPQQQQPQLQQPQLSKQSDQQAQLYFTNYVQANTSAAMAGAGYYLQRNRPDNQQQQQQQQQGSKSQGSIPPPTSSSGMFSAAAQFAAQSAVGQHQLMPLPLPYVHAVSTAAPVKLAEQKQPAGE